MFNLNRITKSEEETIELGREFAFRLKPSNIVLFYGDLGAGKTTFIKGIAKGLGIKTRVISPTFVLQRSHVIEQLKKSLIHIDLYRLEKDQTSSLGIDDLVSDGNIVLVEWAERLELLPASRWEVRINHKSENERSFNILQIVDTSIKKAIETFKKGGIVIFPTDTAFGIGCRIDNEETVKRLFEIRKRPESKPLLALVDNIEMAEKYVDIPQEVRQQLLEKYWPGGLTIIFKSNNKVSHLVNAGTNTLAIRVPDHKTLREIIKAVGVPIVAPSANIAGDKTPLTFSEVNEDLKKSVDYVLNGECTTKGQSTIINSTKTPWKIVRQGVIKIYE